MVIFGGVPRAGKGHEEEIWGAGSVLILDLDVGYMDICSLKI